MTICCLFNFLLLARFKGQICDGCQRRSVRRLSVVRLVVISRKLSKIDSLEHIRKLAHSDCPPPLWAGRPLPSKLVVGLSIMLEQPGSRVQLQQIVEQMRHIKSSLVTAVQKILKSGKICESIVTQVLPRFHGP